MSSTAETRIASFKKVVDATEGRRRRQDVQVQMRKAKKEDQLAKRRQMVVKEEQLVNVPGKKLTAADIPRLVKVLQASNMSVEQVLDAVRGLRRLLSVEKKPPVEEIIAAGALPLLVKLIHAEEHTELMFEATWALTNIASTNWTRAVVESNCVAQLIKLLRHNIGELREQSAWCLGNIAGDATDLRDMLLRDGMLFPLLENVASPTTMSLLNNVVWAISNLCRGKPAPAFDQVQPCIVPILGLLAMDEVVSDEVKVDALWTLSYLTDGPNEQIQFVIEQNAVPILMKMLESDSSGLLTPTVRCIGNLVTGDHEQTQAVIDGGLFKFLPKLLGSIRKNIRKETCWMISNIAAGTSSQISDLLKKRGIVNQIINFAIDSPWEIRKESIWTVANIFTSGDHTQIQSLIEMGGLEAICSVLREKDARMLLVALEALDSILLAGVAQGANYPLLVEELDGVTMVEELQEHANDSVYNAAIRILEKYFGVEDEAENENMAPATTSDGTFAFGTPSKQLFPPTDDAAMSPVFNFGGNSMFNT